MKQVSSCVLALLLFAPHINYSYELHTLKQLTKANFDMKHNPAWIEELNQCVSSIKKPQVPVSSVQQLPLAHKFPGLRVSYVKLCTLPTPVIKLEQLSKEIEASIYIKCDDQSGSAHYGGNKPRKLEFELGRALNRDATSIITFGCAGSNHAVATSEWATQLGLQPICMLKPQANSHVVRKNLLLHQTIGTELHYAPDNDTRKVVTFGVWLDLINAGKRPYIIPTGGSTPLGALGFVNAAFELKEQIDNGLMPEPDYIYVACGSCATTAGLLLGCKLAGLKCKIIAIAVEPEEKVGEFYEGISTLFKKTNQLLHSLTNGQAPLVDLCEDDFEINLNFAGPDYAIFTPECIAARDLLKKTEGITTEGTYTGKALAALLADCTSKKTDRKKMLFWNTYCGQDFSSRIEYADYKKLPECFYPYFEQDVQALDYNGKA